MHDARPSRTAMRVAVRRAAHQLFDHPLVLADAVAVPIIGAEAAAQLADPAQHRESFSRALRSFLVARSRVAEDELARAVERGVGQYVILGAGLDTFPYRNPFPALRTFEVDYPATQAWKQDMLAAAEIPLPASLTFAPVDFERHTLEEGLARAGFRRDVPAFFSWLGVTMYLTEEAIASTLSLVASTSPGGGLVFDYAVPRASLDSRAQRAFDEITRRVAAIGEPFHTFFEPVSLHQRLVALGLRPTDDLGKDEINARFFSDRGDGLGVSGTLGRVVVAVVAGTS